MKRFFTLLLLLSAIQAMANDTLTRSQIYNFSVGDTFDYRAYTLTRQPWSHGGAVIDSNVTYFRYAINQIFYSQDSSVKYIQRVNVFPNAGVFDTIMVQNTNEYEVYSDTLSCFTQVHGVIKLDSASIYNGRITNDIEQPAECVGPGYITNIFGNGIGIVLSEQDGGCGPCGSWYDSLILIYYNIRGGETWGTPYSSSYIQQSTAIEQRISLFPAANDGTFNVKVTDGTLLPFNLIIYDLTGREVKQLSINSLNNNVSIDPCSSGVYVWKAQLQGKFLQSGKMIVN